MTGRESTSSAPPLRESATEGDEHAQEDRTGPRPVQSRPVDDRAGDGHPDIQRDQEDRPPPVGHLPIVTEVLSADQFKALLLAIVYRAAERSQLGTAIPGTFIPRPGWESAAADYIEREAADLQELVDMAFTAEVPPS